MVAVVVVDAVLVAKYQRLSGFKEHNHHKCFDIKGDKCL
jgi:hypothetical protein